MKMSVTYMLLNFYNNCDITELTGNAKWVHKTEVQGSHDRTRIMATRIHGHFCDQTNECKNLFDIPREMPLLIKLSWKCLYVYVFFIFGRSDYNTYVFTDLRFSHKKNCYGLLIKFILVSQAFWQSRTLVTGVCCPLLWPICGRDIFELLPS